jgi:hypothetical protein
MQFFFSTVAIYNPCLAIDLPEHLAYPISQPGDNGLDLDYTALLLGQKFFIDKIVYNGITEGQFSFLKPMANTLKKLYQNELLEIIDMGEIVTRNRNKIMDKVDLLLENPLMWIDDVRSQWEIVKYEFIKFHNDFGSSNMYQLNTGHCGVENWLGEIGESDNNYLRNEIVNLFESKKKKLLHREITHLKGALKFIIAQILCTDLLRHELGIPFLNWDDAQPYYDRLYATRWDDIGQTSAIVRQAKILFDFIIPELKPNNIDEVIRFVRDNKAVESMRLELFSRVRTGENVSKEWFTEYINQVFKHELVTKNKIRKFRWLGSIAGIILPGASLFQEALLEAGAYAGEHAIENSDRSFHWYYALQNAGIKRIK